MTQRIFTPQEANKTLPLVKRIVADILEMGTTLRRAAAGGKKSQEAEDEIVRIQDRVRELIAELEQIGCYYKDWGFEMGLVDFPGEIDNEIVFLCWRSDEAEVTWYHPIKGGYAMRAPIPPELLVPR